MTLEELLTAAAEEIGATTQRKRRENVEFRHGQRLFAAAKGDETDVAIDEEILTEVAAEVGAERATTAGGTEFRRDDHPFGFAAGNVVEVKLDPEIAEAALRTPSTSASSRGASWVRLAPSGTEPAQMDLDRARAWFLSAWRAAGK